MSVHIWQRKGRGISSRLLAVSRFFWEERPGICSQMPAICYHQSVTSIYKTYARLDTFYDGPKDARGFGWQCASWFVACTFGTISQSLCHEKGEARGDEPIISTERSSNDRTKEYDTAQWRVFTDRARELANQRKYGEAQAFLEKALRHAEKGFGKNDPHVASAKQNLAEMYRLTKNYEKAAPLYDDALNILKETYGMKDIRLAFALHNVAGFYMLQRKFALAEEYYMQSLEVKRNAVGPGHTETCNTMFHLSELHWLQHNHDKAVKYGTNALQALKMTGTKMDAYTRRQVRTAEMLLTNNQAQEARALLMEILEKAPEQDWKIRADTLESLSRVEHVLKKYDESISFIHKALIIRERNKVEYPIKYCACLRMLSSLYQDYTHDSNCTGEMRLVFQKKACRAAQDAISWARASLENVLSQAAASSHVEHRQARIRAQNIALELSQCRMLQCIQHRQCVKEETLYECVKDIIRTLERTDTWPHPISGSGTLITPEEFHHAYTQTERRRLVMMATLIRHVNDILVTTQEEDNKAQCEKILLREKEFFPRGIPSWLLTKDSA